MLDEKDLQILQSLFAQSESRMMARMDQLDERMDRIEARIDRIEERIDRIEERMDRIEERIDRIEERMDRIEERMDRIEGCIDQLEGRVDQLDESIKATESRIMAYIESDVLPRFDRLADGHQLLSETLAPTSRVKKLEEEVAFLKPLVLSTFADVEKLKKAQ